MDDRIKTLQEVIEAKFDSIEEVRNILKKLDLLSNHNKDEALLGCAYVMAVMGQVNIPLLILRLIDDATINRLPSLKKLLADAGVEVHGNNKDNKSLQELSIEIE